MSRFTFCLICCRDRDDSELDAIAHAPCDQRLAAHAAKVIREAEATVETVPFDRASGMARYEIS